MHLNKQNIETLKATCSMLEEQVVELDRLRGKKDTSDTLKRRLRETEEGMKMLENQVKRLEMVGRRENKLKDDIQTKSQQMAEKILELEDNLRETQATAQRMETHQAQMKEEDLMDKETLETKRAQHEEEAHEKFKLISEPKDAQPRRSPHREGSGLCGAFRGRVRRGRGAGDPTTRGAADPEEEDQGGPRSETPGPARVRKRHKEGHDL